MKKNPPERRELVDFFKSYFQLKRRYPKHAVIVVKTGHEFLLFGEDAEALAKVARVRIHQMRDGMLFNDSPKFFEMDRPKLEAAGYRLVYAEETGEGFEVRSSPAGWLEAPAPLWDESSEWWNVPPDPPRTKRTKPEPTHVQRTLEFKSAQPGSSDTP